MRICASRPHRANRSQARYGRPMRLFLVLALLGVDPRIVRAGGA
jgi:hypothetical protein